MSNTSLAQSNEPNRSNIYDKGRILPVELNYKETRKLSNPILLIVVCVCVRVVVVVVAFIVCLLLFGHHYEDEK